MPRMGVTAQDKKIAGLIQEARKPCVVAVNKWDLIEERTGDKDALKEVLEELRAELFFLDYAPLMLALREDRRVDDAPFQSASNASAKPSRKRIGTGPLNRLLTAAMTAHPPGLRSGKRFKVLYATQPEPEGDSAIPVPEIVIFVNDATLLDESYHRYLGGRIREEQAWEGLPIIFRFRAREPKGESAELNRAAAASDCGHFADTPVPKPDTVSGQTSAPLSVETDWRARC